MIRDMKDRRMSNREIARDLGVSRNTVSKLLRTTRLTDHRKRERGSKLDPYREKIRASGRGEDTSLNSFGNARNHVRYPGILHIRHEACADT